MPLTSINPANGECLRTYAEFSPEACAERLASAAAGFESWRRLSFVERGVFLRATAAALRCSAEASARLMAEEMGKPIAQGRAEIEKCAWACEYFAENAAGFLAPDAVPTEFSRSAVVYQPLGVVLAVMPWNFPFWQLFRCAIPALMAGNTVVLKHASNVSGCALALEAVFQQAGLPAGAFQTLLVSSGQLAPVIGHPALCGLALTGSTEAGRAVAALAGRHLLKTVLELGGSDPYLVLEDADLDHAARVCAASRLINSGQSCIAAKRFIVARPVYAAFLDRFLGALREAKVGDPLDPATTVGPQARRDLRDALHGQVSRSVAAGARCLLGGACPPGPGAFYPPTVLAEVAPGLAAFDEETFGPVAAVTPAADEAEAIRLANLSLFGLGAAVFTADPKRGERVALELQAGCCVVNDLVRSDPRLPFGGIRDSGYGRELGLLGLREFVNAKTLLVR